MCRVYVSRGNPIPVSLFEEAVKWLEDSVPGIKVGFHNQDETYRPEKLEFADYMIVLLDSKTPFPTIQGKGVKSEIDAMDRAGKPVYILYKTIGDDTWQLYSILKMEKPNSYRYDKWKAVVDLIFGPRRTLTLLKEWKKKVGHVTTPAEARARQREEIRLGKGPSFKDLDGNSNVEIVKAKLIYIKNSILCRKTKT